MKIAITGAVTIAIQFGLAIAGRSSFFAHSAFRALAGVTVVLVILTAFSGGGGLSTGQAEDRSNRWVLGAFGVIGLSVFFFSSYTDRIRFWTFDGDTVRWLGVVVCFFGGLLRLIPVYVLGNRFSGLVAIRRSTSWRLKAFLAPSETRAIWGCSSVRWDGCWCFVRAWECCSWHRCWCRS